GLSAIRPVTNSGIIRPLLQVTRSQVVDWLTQHELTWCEDATNQDPGFARNRIRHQLLPQLQVEWNPQLAAILAQTADWALAEDEYWRDELPRLTENWVRFAKGGVILVAGRLTALPVAAARRVIRDVIERVKADLLGVDFAHIEAIRHLAARQEGDGRVQIPGMEAVRSFNWLRFAKSSPQEPFAPIHFVPGTGPLPSSDSLRFVLESNEGIYTIDRVYNEDRKALDWEKVCREVERHPGAALTIRTWRPGDQYQPRGRAGMEKLKDLFQEYRIPSWERPNWPVLAVGNAIAWAGEFGPAAEFAVDTNSRTVLSICWDRQG
ncbi:MAG TPA: tRNA lysidine(34) synthetase TilS, partial [Bryobacteraceae bacterium]